MFPTLYQTFIENPMCQVLCWGLGIKRSIIPKSWGFCGQKIGGGSRMLIPLPRSWWSSHSACFASIAGSQPLAVPINPRVGSHQPGLLQSWRHRLSNLKGNPRPYRLLHLGITQFPAFFSKHQFPFLPSLAQC